ncbi:ABC transporter ATP-binding protein [Irregularibacter muris]|uniref:ABC transporter ATP-binding protein n=1 Tax=Irregularibacter muris TaxID=1796619 RepID=A0AAE3HGV7_9FIRM|nr:ABC transporter ATP-binding protein [Irregularibacter muris]MCR1898804.1 ABC transporter ATP-binding protein [Irregularibacter muris]
MNSLSTKDLYVGYYEKNIITQMNIQFKSNEITTIIGPNGCGKSTLLKALTRLIPHSKGSILLDGQSIAKENTKKLAQKMAILPQTQDSASGLTVGELVSYGRFPYQRGFGKLTSSDYEVIDWALKVTNTFDYKFRTVDSLSGGQRQRVWIAMALAQETETIFLDEPTTYLDMAHQLEVLELLKNLNQRQQRTIIMVLHDLNHAARFSHNMIALKDGKLIKAGTSEDVMKKDILQEVFNIDAEIGRDIRTGKLTCISYDLIRG